MTNLRARQCHRLTAWPLGLVLCGVLGTPGALAADALSLLPDQAEAVVGADLGGVRGSSLYQRLESHFGLSEKLRLEEFAAFTGIEVRDDLDRLTIGAWGPGGDDQAYLAVMEGDLAWSEEALNALAARGQPLEHRGFLLYPVEPTKGDAGAYLSPLTERLAVVGRREAVFEAIDRQQGAGAAPAEYAADLHSEASVAAARGQFWMVAGKAALRSGAAAGLLESGVPGLLDSVESLTLSANLMAGLDLLISGRCADESTASSMSVAAQGLLMMARMNVPRKETGLRQMLAGLQVRAVENRLELTAGLSEAQLMDLIDSAEKRGLAEKLP